MSLDARERNPVAAFVEPLVRVVLFAAGWWLLVIVALTCVEILGRKFFGFSLQGVDEVGGYTLGVTASLALAYALIKRGHTRVDFLLTRFPPAVQAICNVAAMLTLAAIVAYAFLRGITVLSESIEFQSHSTTPLRVALWIPQSGWLVGWALFAATAIAFAVHALWLLAHDRAKLNAYYGPLTVDEEIRAELGENAVDPTDAPKESPRA
jgi:TRAP-type C4-dicarboxylate transport system permease small subunit